jgi:hypothetical protein
MNISKFDSTQFYCEYTTTSELKQLQSQWKGTSGIWDIQFPRASKSVELLASYYKAKYDTAIMIKSVTDKDCTPSNSDLAKFSEDLNEYLKEARGRAAEQEEHREVLLIKYFGVGVYENGHAIPLIYIKKGSEEALFLANSLGLHNDNVHTWIFNNAAKIPVYAIDRWREASATGCYIDALAFIREAIGKENGSYRIPDLLESLINNNTQCTDEKTKLPYNALQKLHPRLLKTFQWNTDPYSNPANAEVKVDKKGRTITEHFTEYKKLSRDGKNLASYVAQKGMKYRGTVEMEFYLQQMRSKDGAELSKELRVKFIEGAKTQLQPKANPSETKDHLHDYACQFAQDNNCKIEPWVYPSKLDEATKPHVKKLPETTHNSFYQTAAIGLLAGAALGVLAACIFKTSPNISSLRNLASSFSTSEIAGHIFIDGSIGACMGILSGAIVGKCQER